jgi:hypothetical protein
MRWELLFADLEAQLDAARAAELAAEVADLTRAERATVPVVARLRATRGAPLTVRLAGGDLVTGTVVEVAEQWLLLGDGPRRALVPLSAVAAVAGLTPTAQPATGGQVARRLGLGHALRALARDRVVVRIATDGGEVAGRLDGVGADHVDVTAVVDGPAARRHPSATGWTVPIGAIRVVRSG